MIDDTQRSALKLILQDPKFKIVEQVINEMIKNYKNQSCKKETEFDTIWAMADNSGKVLVLKELMFRLEELAHA